MPPKIQRWGAYSILITIFVGLTIPAIIWSVSTLVSIAPLTTAVTNLNNTLIDMQKNNADEHGELAQMIYGQNNIIAGGKERLKFVEKRCLENHANIEKCRENHYKAIK